MHTRNITVLQEEAQRLLTLERDILAKMLLAPGVLGELEDGQRGTFTRRQTQLDIETLQGELTKLEHLELVIAVVGTMKAGKSTTINAIVGTEVLPNRNRPMTALPTLIRHTPGQAEPVLEFANSAPIDRLMVQLRDAIHLPDNRPLVKHLNADTEMAALLEQIERCKPFSQQYNGASGIFNFLRTLNDLVRLSGELAVPFPFGDYGDIHNIPSIRVEFAHLRDAQQTLGALTLLDTPGPNEAGQSHLRKMLSEQLAKASAVLAVLDYTQLKSDADAQIQAELKEIANLAEGRMYALVNKFDQRDRHSDSAEVTKHLVADTLMQGRIGVDSVYPVSSRHAYLANRARTALALHQELPDCALEDWVADFGQVAFGSMWEMNIGNTADVMQRADALWKASLFAAPIDNVIRFAQARAAILALGSAAAKLLDTATRLANFFNVRETALGKSSRELKDQIEALKCDIDRVRLSEESARKDAENTLLELKECSDTLLRTVKSEIGASIEQMFSDRRNEEAAQASEEQKDPRPSGGNPWAHLLAAIFVPAVEHARRDAHFDPNTPVMTFSSRSDALEKMGAVQKELSRIIATGETRMKISMSRALAEFQQSFSDNVLQRAKLIVDEMRSRLEGEGFDLRLNIPAAEILTLSDSGSQLLGDLIDEKTETRSARRRTSGAWGTVCRWLNTDDWGWEDYSFDVEVYTIDSRVIKLAVGKDIDKVFKGLNDSLSKKIRVPLEKGIDEFFRQFKETVEHIRGDLMQGLQDIDRTKNEQEELLRRLAELKENIPAIRIDSEGLKQDVADSFGAWAGVQA